MIIGIIPARYESSRFPGKPLADIRGKSMIQRVYQQANKCQKLSEVWVATDDERIYTHVTSFGGKAVMTQKHHASGTDRCKEAMELVGGQAQYIINIQGDEPFIDPSQIDTLASVLEDGTVELATLVIPVTEASLLTDPGEVKVVMNVRGEAMYFSRSIIPYLKDVPQAQWFESHAYFRHAGMYAYRKDVLSQIAQIPVSALEKAESLEQLRWLEHGFRIRCAVTTFESHCVDTPEDIRKVLEKFPENF